MASILRNTLPYLAVIALIDKGVTGRARPHQTSCKQLPTRHMASLTQSAGQPFANAMLSSPRNWHSWLGIREPSSSDPPTAGGVGWTEQKNHVRVSICQWKPVAWFPFHTIRATRRGFNNVETLVRKAQSLEIGSSALPDT